MRFAILGNHPDGLEMASALAASGRHQVAVHTTAVPEEQRRCWGASSRIVPDLEEVLADPEIDAVIVAGSLANRAIQLRRALQSERHVLCVHPADISADIAHEAAMIQRDTGEALLPLLVEGLHPGVLRLAELCRSGVLAGLRLVEMERWAPNAVLLGGPGHKQGVPGWDVLRRLGGEIAELSALAEDEELTPEAPVFLSGRFARGGLFQTTLVPNQPETRWRLTVTGAASRAELVLPQGWPGPATLTWRDHRGTAHEETWESWRPWSEMVEIFEAVVEGRPAERRRSPEPLREAIQVRRPDKASLVVPTLASVSLSWQDEVRCLELDEASRRSARHRRATVLEYPEASETTGLKGTMTLIGCGLLWAVLLLLILSVWLPWLGWTIVPALCVFLLLQILVWSVSAKPEPPEADCRQGLASAPPAMDTIQPDDREAIRGKPE